MTGGTGFLGTALRQRLEELGHATTCLSRTRAESAGPTTFVLYERLDRLEPHDWVINLAGESVVGLWTRAKRRAIYESRIETTRRLADWIEKSPEKPSVFLSGSAVGIYGDAGDAPIAESADVSRAPGFLAKVCRDWEHAASSAAWRGTRTVLLRTGQVLDPGGGFLAKALPMMRRFPIVVLGPG
ncbi:MAG TPA: NAD-dependent epimerase/dehydratase family protein, partial [Fimbriimonadaceae bacterium]|nr:NAD-dependent epimerase/dehydratase family protein [Fimbriimonadaceae bacterium]